MDEMTRESLHERMSDAAESKQVESPRISRKYAWECKRRPKDTEGLRKRIFSLWLSPEGRHSKRLYIYHMAGCALFLLVLFFVVAVFLAELFQGFYEGRSLPGERTALVIVLIALCAFWLPLWCTVHIFFCSMLRRWHDAGYDDRDFLWRVIYPVVLVAVLGIAYQKMQEMQLGDLTLFYGVKLHIGIAFVVDACIFFALMLFLLFADGETCDNAFGTRRSAMWVAPEIQERPREEVPMLTSIFFYRGRLNRKRFILRLLFISIPFILFLLVFDLLPWKDIAYLLLGFPIEALEIVVPGVFRSVITLESLISLAYSLLFLYCVQGLFVHRLHDLGMSGAWMFLPSVIKATLDGWHALHVQTMTAEQTLCYTAAFLLYILYQSLLLAYLVFVKGDDAINRYGENSLISTSS